MRGKDLNVPPGKADQIRREGRRHLMQHSAALRLWVEGQVKDALPYIRTTPMNEVSQIGRPDRVDLFTGKKDVENGIHKCHGSNGCSKGLCMTPAQPQARRDAPVPDGRRRRNQGRRRSLWATLRTLMSREQSWEPFSASVILLLRGLRRSRPSHCDSSLLESLRPATAD
jgi:hypothetical protein